jgi:hypothetical protein
MEGTGVETGAATGLSDARNSAEKMQISETLGRKRVIIFTSNAWTG